MSPNSFVTALFFLVTHSKLPGILQGISNALNVLLLYIAIEHAMYLTRRAKGNFLIQN